MKKTMNYLAFAGMGVVAQLFLFSVIYALHPFAFTVDNIGVPLLMSSSFFLIYRFFIDWNIFTKQRSTKLHYLSKELRKPVTRHEVFFPAFMGAFMVVANLHFLAELEVNWLQVWAYASFSILLSWIAFEFGRVVWNAYHVSQDTLKEVKLDARHEQEIQP